MTVNDVISFVDRTYHNDVDQSVKIDLIAQCDTQLRHDLLRTHESGMCDHAEDKGGDAKPYDSHTVLFAPDRYADLYRWYLQARLALILSQAGMYQTYAVLYESAREEFAKEYNRTHMPRHRVRALKLT